MQLINFNEITSSTPQWLWEPYFPLGKITIVQGDPGDGKTTLILQLAAMLSRGQLPHMPDVEYEPFEVIYLNAEDGYGDTIKPRLEAAGADCSHIHTLSEDIHDSPITLDDSRLEGAIRGLNARLLILDPLQAFLGAKVDMHRANEIRPVMRNLAEMADRTNCAVVLIGHMNKAQGLKASYRGLGSIDFTAAARSVLVVARDKNRPNVRVMMQIKNSLAQEGKPIAFELRGSDGVVFLGNYSCNVDDMLLGVGGSYEYNEAINILREELKDGEKPQKELMESLSQLEVSHQKIKDIKKELNIKSIKKSDGWYWKINDKNAQYSTENLCNMQ